MKNIKVTVLFIVLVLAVTLWFLLLNWSNNLLCKNDGSLLMTKHSEVI